MTGLNLPAGLRKLQLVVYRLEEKVSAAIENLFSVVELAVGVERDQDRAFFGFAFILLCFQPGLFFCPQHDAFPVRIQLFGELGEGTELTDDHGSAFSVVIDVRLGDIK